MIVRLHSVAESLQRRAAALLDPRRRFNCQDQDRPGWHARAEAAVDMLHSFLASDPNAGTLEIADLGCGNERLRRVLTARFGRPFEYVGYDLHPQSERVQRLDVESELPERVFDVVFCLGLVEYLRDPELFARRLHDICGLAVVSYVLADAEGSLPPAERRKRGWRTDYSRVALDDVFTRADFACETFATVDDGGTGLWLMAARKSASL
jgi:SAM-dependent methyltransferase